MQTAQGSRRVSKGTFAKLLNVSPGRVSQLIRENKISGDAIIGTGNKAVIDLDIAEQQLGVTLDFAQRAAQQLAKVTEPGATVTAEQQRIAIAKAEMAEINLREAQRKEREAAGVYIKTADATATAARELSELVQAWEQWLPTVAEALELAHGIPHKVGTVLLRDQFRQFRQRRADLATSAIAGMAETIDDGDPGEPAALGQGGDGERDRAAAPGGLPGLGGEEHQVRAGEPAAGSV
jgi:hypothetical protein